MDSSGVLRQQSHNKIHSDFHRMKNEHNKIVAEPKPSKPASNPHPSKQDSENKAPGRSEPGKKATLQPGVSRLPVLSKSLHLKTPSTFTQSHSRWEEKPLAGKAKTKRPCTRPIPFNLSQPKSSATSQNHQPKPRTPSVHPRDNVHSVRLKTHNNDSKPTKQAAVSNGLIDSTHKSRGKAADRVAHLSGQSDPVKASATLSNLLSAETCLKNMNLLSLKDPVKKPHGHQNTQLSSAKASTGENFQPDHAAFLSILRNEGVTAVALGSATPHSKPYNYQPQRVSVMSRQKAATAAGLGRSLPFSPNTAALQSILQNDGVAAGGLLCATPRQSVCPPGRATPIYTAQRVPVRTNPTEATGGPVVTLKETPQTKWSPQRVRNTRHQPMSAMKWHSSSQQSPYINTPGPRSLKPNIQLHKEKVAQRLFEDPNEQISDDPETQTEQLKPQASSSKVLCEEELESGTAESSEDEEVQSLMSGRRPFIQEPQRESVIFFSTGKKLLRAARLDKQEKSSDQDRLAPVSSTQRQDLQDKTLSQSESTCTLNPPVLSLHRDKVALKSGVSAAVALLRKRLPPPEELRLDEEVATYTSVSVSAAPGFSPPRPRCGNPLASILHFVESTRFVPIDFDFPSGPSTHFNAPQQER